MAAAVMRCRCLGRAIASRAARNKEQATGLLMGA